MMNTFTAQELADFYQKVADGGEIQTSGFTDSTWESITNGPSITSSSCLWRIKPTKKVIDLSVLIESGIDCEFSDESEFLCMNTRIANLRVVDRGPSWYASNSPNQYLYCRPRMNHKHAWQDGDCPLPEGFIVRLTKWSVHVPHISHIELTTKQWISSKANEHTTIQAFEVLGVADGYVMPWEQEND